MSIRFTDREYQALLDAAERIQSGWGRETVNASMDCDYGHDVIEELQAALVGRAHQQGKVEGAREVAAAVEAVRGTPTNYPAMQMLTNAREAVARIEGSV